MLAPQAIKYRPVSIGWMLLLAGLAGSATADAALWQLEPRVRVGADHDSNRGFTTQPLSDQAWNASGELRLSYATPRANLTLTPAAEVQRFDDASLPDATRQSLDLDWLWAGPTSQLRFTGGRRRQSTLFSELRRSGLVDLDSDRRDDTASLTWSRSASPRWTASAQLGWSSTAFTGPLTARLTDYRYPSASLQLSYGASERTRLVMAASAGELRVDGNPFDSRDEALSLGVDRDMNERTRWSLRLGANRTSIASRQIDGYSGRFEFTSELQRGELTLSAARSVSPTGFGALVSRTEAGIGYRHRFSQRTSASVAVSAVRNDDLGGLRSGERARFEAADASLDRRVSESWRVSLQAGSARALESAGLGEVDGWRVGVSMVWEPRARAVSR